MGELKQSLFLFAKLDAVENSQKFHWHTDRLHDVSKQLATHPTENQESDKEC